MEKKIYLPSYAKKQIETSDNASVWAKPIPYSDKPSNCFSLSLTYDEEDERFYDPVESGMFYPDRTEPDTVLELLEEVNQSEIEKNLKKDKEKKIKEKKGLIGKYSDAIYRCFFGQGDEECWARYYKGKIDVFSQHVYYFSGLGTVPLFTINQEKCLDRVLTEGAGLNPNREEVKLCNGSYDFQKGFSQKNPKFEFSEEDISSLDGKTYKLFQDHDDGARGWAIFSVKPKKRARVIYEDHCSNVRDWMMENNMAFLKELGFNVNFKFLKRYNHDFYEKDFIPTKEDFESDFHINEKGRKKKA